MVNILKTSFGDMLHTEPVNENIQYLPRLNLLKHKILIKVSTTLPMFITMIETGRCHDKVKVFVINNIVM